jgi:hypothetical protein
MKVFICDLLFNPLNYVPRAANCPLLEDPSKTFYEDCMLRIPSLCSILHLIVKSHVSATIFFLVLYLSPPLGNNKY